MSKKKILLMIRHAKTVREIGAGGDFDRPLNDRGLSNAPMMAERCRKKIPLIDVMISSPARRAKTTAELFSKAYGIPFSEVVLLDDLYLAPEETLRSAVTAIDDRFNVAAVFCHNPGVTDFVNSLDVSVKIDNMPTCAVYAIACDTSSWKNFFSAPQSCLFVDYPKKS